MYNDHQRGEGMYTMLITVAIAICAAALIITLIIAKAENKKIKKYQETGSSNSSQLQRSNEYEKKSLQENLPLLAFIYGLTFLIVLIVMLIFLFG